MMFKTSPLQSLQTAISSPRRCSLGSQGCCCMIVNAFLNPVLNKDQKNKKIVNCDAITFT